MSVSVLKGVKVLDFSRILAAPYASQLLADHGATVWKVEKPSKSLYYNVLINLELKSVEKL